MKIQQKIHEVRDKYEDGMLVNQSSLMKNTENEKLTNDNDDLEIYHLRNTNTTQMSCKWKKMV